MFEYKILEALLKANNRKAAGPNGMPVELFQIAPERFASAFFYRLKMSERFACTLPG